MMKKRATVDDLMEDLVVEILSRVPAASLAGLRSTCKEWNSLIKDAKFAEKHYANAPRQWSLLIMLIDFRVYLANVDYHGINDNIVKVASQFSLKDPLSSASEEEVDICEIFHCDGLLLCSTKDNRLVVWNPCSGETSWIQPRKSYKTLDYYALGKSSSNEYKILRVDQRGNGYMGQCLVEYEIYDFTSNSWSGVAKTRDWVIQRMMSRGTYVNGNTYWLACSFPGMVEFLLSFDFSTERFTRVSLPGDHLSYYVFSLSVTREEQQLCMLTTRDRTAFDIDVWVASEIDQSTGVMSWSKFLTMEQDIYKPYFTFVNGTNFLVDRENKVLVCRGKHGHSNSFLHIMGEDKYIQVDRHKIGSKCSLLVSYVPTLVQIQQKASLGV